jgi:hypothetical protein
VSSSEEFKSSPVVVLQPNRPLDVGLLAKKCDSNLFVKLLPNKSGDVHTRIHLEGSASFILFDGYLHLTITNYLINNYFVFEEHAIRLISSNLPLYVEHRCVDQLIRLIKKMKVN